MNRFKVFDVNDIRKNGEGIQFSDGSTVVKIEGVTLSYPKEIQAALIPHLEASGLRLEWMD